MNAKELVISIRSLFDSKGTTEAQRQLAATGESAGKASRNVASVGGSSGATSAKMQQAAGAAGALAGALGQGQGGLATAARTAAGALGALRAGWIGIAIVVITVAVAAIDFFKTKSEKALAALKDQHDAFHRGLKRSADLKLDNLVRQYKDAADAAGKAADAAERLLDAGRRLADARNERALAELDAEETEALNKVDPQDELAVEKVKLDYANKREEIKTRSAIADAVDNRDAAKNKLKSGEAAEIKALNDIRALKQLRDQNPSEKANKAVETAQSELDALSNGVAASRLDVRTAEERLGVAYAKRRTSQASLSGQSAARDDAASARDDAARDASAALADAEAKRSDMDLERARAEASAADADSTARRERAESDQAAAALAKTPKQLTYTREKLGIVASRESDQASAAEAAAAAENEALKALISTMIEKQKANADMINQANAKIANTRTSD